MATQRIAACPKAAVGLVRGVSTSTSTSKGRSVPPRSTPRPPPWAAAVPLLSGSGSQGRWKSSEATTATATATTQYGQAIDDGYVVTTKGYKKRVDALDLTFKDHEAAFRSKSTWEVCRALLVFQLCSIGPLVENNAKLMKLGQRLLGKRLFGSIMKSTFYGQFVAGEDREDIKPTIHKMHSFGVKSILDYSVEEDISPEQAEQKELQGVIPDKETLEEAARLKDKGTHEDGIRRYHAHKTSETADRRYQLHSARTYFYEGEAACEKNMEIFLRCIEAVADSTHSTGFSAIKLTALGRPSLLLQLSEVIVRARRYFAEVSGQEGFVIEGKVSKEAFEQRFKEKAHYETLDDNPEAKKWLEQMTFDKKGLIHLFSWSGLIDSNLLLKDVFKVPSLTSGKMEPLISALTDDEEEQFRNMLNRLATVFKAAKELDVRVMVDAEQTYFQPAIHRITMEMMKKFNTEKAIVFNTYQCYLKIAYHSLLLDLEQASRQNFYFGAKLVRGAYMIQERERATALGYEDPINPSHEATSEMYHRCLTECMRRMAELKQAAAAGGSAPLDFVAIMVASHNADTVRFAIQKMKELDIKPEDRLICFGQLLGMCDNMSFPLGQAGYSVYKYVPYGPVNEVLPYLSRRAHENKGMMTKLKSEKQLLRRELLRRILKGQLVYSPKGDYVPVGFENVKAFK